MKYKVKWNYKSSLGGPWLKGDVVEMKEDLAEAVNKDSPGVLEEAEGSKTKADRMLANAEFSRKAEKSHKQEPIDKTVFKAVKK